MNKPVDTSFQEFLRMIRRVGMVVLLAWAILSAGKLVKLETSRNPFTPPHPPFQAVSSTGLPVHQQTHSRLETVAEQIISGVWQNILYGAR